MGIEEITLNLIINLLGAAIYGKLGILDLEFFKRRKVQRQIEDSIAEIVEPLLPFFKTEKLSEEKQFRLVQTCVRELEPLLERPELIFEGSLNGQKIFEDLYSENGLPEAIIEDDLKDTYSILFPRIATLLCTMPAIVKEWETKAWSENFKRFDEISIKLRDLFKKIDGILINKTGKNVELLTTVRRIIAQKTALGLDFTGLRADKPMTGKFDDYFVHPEIERLTTKPHKSEKNQLAIRVPAESFKTFAKKGLNVVFGEPGAGKSTWLNWLQQEILGPNGEGLGIRVEFRHFSDKSLPSYQELIRNLAGTHYKEEITSDLICNWLDNCKVVFLLDGFDEIVPDNRDNALGWIKELQIATNNSPIVITSRPLSTIQLDTLKSGSNFWKVLPFDKVRILDYMERWHKFTPLVQGIGTKTNENELAELWLSDPTIKPLTGNPLLLSTLLMVHHLDGSLPSGRSQLYERYVDGMLGLWDDRRKVTANSVKISLGQKRQILRNLATHFFLSEREEFEEDLILTWLKDFLKKMGINENPERILENLRERSGLIVGPGIYSFTHKSISEYLVAETVLQGDQKNSFGKRIDRMLLLENRNDDRWNTVTFLWAGLAPIVDVIAFIDSCLSCKALALGSGILLDQYQKIAIDDRKNFILRIISDASDEFFSQNSFWGSPLPNNFFQKLAIPDFEIRSILGDVEFSNLIYRAIRDGSIPASAISKANGHVKSLLWQHFVLLIDDLDWLQFIEDNFVPFERDSEVWLFWAVENITRRYLREKINMPIEAIFHSIKSKYRDCEYAFFMGLISAILRKENSSSSKHTIQKRCSGKIQNLIEFIAENDFNTFDGEIISETHDWDMGYYALSNNPSSDLLKEAVFEIKSWVKEGFLNETIASKNVSEKLENLIKSRDKGDFHWKALD